MPFANHDHLEANGSLRMETIGGSSTHGNDSSPRSVAEIKQTSTKEEKYAGEYGEHGDADQAAL
jgi:hypothetical protein